MSDMIRFTLDGRAVTAAPDETIWQVAKRTGIDIPHLCYTPEPGYRGGRQLPGLHGGDRRRAGACGLLHPQAERRDGGARRRGARSARPRHGDGAAARRSATGRVKPRPVMRALGLGGSHGAFNEPLSRAAVAGSRSQPHGDGGQSRRLHPLHALRARVPGSAGQRRDRHGGPGRAQQDRLRLRRPHGREHLRRLRRMRAGLPDRRAHAGQGGG